MKVLTFSRFLITASLIIGVIAAWNASFAQSYSQLIMGGSNCKCNSNPDCDDINKYCDDGNYINCTTAGAEEGDYCTCTLDINPCGTRSGSTGGESYNCSDGPGTNEEYNLCSES